MKYALYISGLNGTPSRLSFDCASIEAADDVIASLATQVTVPFTAELVECHGIGGRDLLRINTVSPTIH